MNELTLPPQGVMTAFSDASLPDLNWAAQQGLTSGFAVLGYKGRNWWLKHRGNTEMMQFAPGQPMASLDLVIVGVSPHVSKVYYEKRYTEGDQGAPDCWSVDGQYPSAEVPDEKKQNATCANCRWNAFGSRINESGKKAKACQDSRRLAVVPHGDLVNEQYGGPMLLRIPPMSLVNFADFTRTLARHQVQPYAVVCRVGFDYNVAYPLITFTAAGWVTEAEVAPIKEHILSDMTERVLAYDDEATAQGETSAGRAEADPLAQGGPAQGFSQPTTVATPVQPVQPTYQQQPSPAQQVQPAFTPPAQPLPPPTPFTQPVKRTRKPAAAAAPVQQAAPQAPAQQGPAPTSPFRQSPFAARAAAPAQQAPVQQAQPAQQAPAPIAPTPAPAPDQGTVAVQASDGIEAMVGDLFANTGA